MENYDIITKKEYITEKNTIIKVDIKEKCEQTTSFYCNTVENVVVPFWFNNERWNFLKNKNLFLKNDIIISTYPKCGTTFLEQIVLLLINGIKNKNFLDPSSKNSYKKDTNFGKIWIESLVCFKNESEKRYNPPFILEGEEIEYNFFMNEISNPRIIKTHANLNLLLDKKVLTNNKILIVTRNPLDTCVSHYYHFVPRLEKKFEIKINFNKWAMLWLNGLVPFGSWFEWTREWYKKNKNNSNILFIYYEDCLLNPAEKIEEISKFIDISVNKDEIQEIIQESSFKAMSEQYEKFNGDKNNFNHLRKGIIGDWRNHFDDNLYNIFISKFKEELKGLDLIYYLGDDLFWSP